MFENMMFFLTGVSLTYLCWGYVYYKRADCISPSHRNLVERADDSNINKIQEAE